MKLLRGNALSIKKKKRKRSFVLLNYRWEEFEGTALEYPPIIYTYVYKATPKYTCHSIPMFLAGAFLKRSLDLKARVK